MKNWKPLFIENSKIPVWLSKIAPIEISAITLGPVVISRDKMSEITKRHETIHFQQYLETLFIGFLLFYFATWVFGLFIMRDKEEAYRNIPFEKEAYAYQNDENYLQNRKRFAWIHYISS